MPVQSQSRGILAMVVGAAFLISGDAISKHLAEHQPVGQLMFVRQIASLGFILLFVRMTSGLGILRMVDVKGQLVRGALFVGTTLLVILSLAYLPITTVTAVGFAGPIWVAALSVPMLGERVSLRRWLAIIGGFLGLLLIVQPGTTSFTWALILPALLSLVSAFRDVLTRSLSRTDSPISILFWSSVLVIAVSATSMPFASAPITMADAGWYILNGLLTALAHFLMITAYQLADAAFVSNFRYSGQIWAIILGALIWQHFPDTLTLIGSAVIIMSGIVMIERAPKPVSTKADGAPAE